jgi:hypothetical protein
VGLFTLALFRRRHLREGALSVLVLPILAIVLCSVHPKVESRMLHSWMAVSWVAAGAGFGSLAAGRARASHAGARLRRAAAVVSVLVLMVGQGPGALGAGHSASAGHRGGHASLLDVTDTYLPDLSGSRSPAILSTIPCRPLLAWTFLERYPHRRDLELPRWDAVTTREDLRHAFDTWVATTQSDTVVVLDIPRDSYFGVRLPGPGAAVHRAVIDLMQAQDEFLEMRRWFFDRYGLTVTLWRRRPPER